MQRCQRLGETDEEYDLEKVQYMISLGHNLKHQNYVFAYLVALRSANSKVRLSAKVRAELDAVFLATMGTKKHRDFVYAYHRAWLLHNTTATFGKTCASVQVLARLIARRNLHFTFRPRVGPATDESDLVFGCCFHDGAVQQLPSVAHPGPTEAAEIALLYALERLIPTMMERLSSVKIESLFFCTQGTSPMLEQQFRDKRISLEQRNLPSEGMYVSAGDEMRGEESNKHDKDWLHQRGAPLTTCPAAALLAATIGEAHGRRALMAEVGLMKSRKRKASSHRDVNADTNTLSTGTCAETMHVTHTQNNRLSTMAPRMNHGRKQ